MNLQKKYLKYKTKYLNLKKQMGGSGYVINEKSCNIENRQIFFDYVKSNNKNIIENSMYKLYLIELIIMDKTYICFVQYDNLDILEAIYFLNNNCTISYINDFITEHSEDILEAITVNSFIQIFFTEMDTITTNLDFDTFPEKNKLNTIMEILEYIYKHFCYEEIKLKDEAKFKCPGLEVAQIKQCFDEQKEYPTYKSLIYRIFSTNVKLSDLSIYTRFGYKYSITEEEKVELEENLVFLRNYKISDFIKLLETIYTASIKIKNNFYFKDEIIIIICKLKEFSSDDTLHNFFISLDLKTMEECSSNIIFYKLFNSFLLYNLNGIVAGKIVKLTPMEKIKLDETLFIAKINNILLLASNLEKKI
jgi:hypothetical protein